MLASIASRACNASGIRSSGHASLLARHYSHSTKGSFMSLRKFKLRKNASVDNVIDLCDKEFIPLLRKHPDFVAYYATIVGPDQYYSVSLFQTEQGAQESAKLAKDWTERNLNDKLELVESSQGKTLVHHDSWSKMFESHSA